MIGHNRYSISNRLKSIMRWHPHTPLKSKIGTRLNRLELLKDIKSLIIKARLENDDNRAAELSEAKSIVTRLNKRTCKCIDCGTTIARGLRCAMHNYALRRKRKLTEHSMQA